MCSSASHPIPNIESCMVAQTNGFTSLAKPPVLGYSITSILNCSIPYPLAGFDVHGYLVEHAVYSNDSMTFDRWVLGRVIALLTDMSVHMCHS